MKPRSSRLRHVYALRRSHLGQLLKGALRLLVVFSLLLSILFPVSHQAVQASNPNQSIREQLGATHPTAFPGSESQAAKDGGRDLAGLFARELMKGERANQQRNSSGFTRGLVINETNEAPNQEHRYIVRLWDEPLATYGGGTAGLAATSPRVTGRARLDPNAQSTVAYRTYLRGQRDSVIGEINQILGRQVEVLIAYEFAYNGFALHLKPSEALQVALLPNVAQITRDFLRQLQTDFGPAWLGAPGVWDGSALGGNVGTRGEGVVVGIIDGGIDMNHPAFATLSADGYVHSNPRDQNYGVCDPLSFQYAPELECTGKLIGAWDFVNPILQDGRPLLLDEESHGTHVASTAAGNVVNAATLNAPFFIYSAPISGVAPRANIVAYDVCILEGCFGAAIVGAIDQAVFDGVDVINFSIGGGSDDPWAQPDTLAFLNAVDAGIFVATSAGNSGPDPETVGSPADAPWMTAVGSNTHNRRFFNQLVDMSGGDNPPGDMEGQSLTIGYGPAPVLYAGDFGDPLCATPFEPGTFNGEIVLCDRGVVGRVAKGANIKAGGAGGYILANDEASGQSVIAAAHELPAIHVSFSDGVILKEWLASGSGHVATIADAVQTTDETLGDVMSGFSSRGPDFSVPDMIKPDVTAPGDAIFAAFTTEQGLFNIISGTSMSSPHVTGAAALLRALYPDWSTTAVRSALMLTARTEGIRKEDGSTAADPFDRGSGHVDVSRAANAGFVLEESASNFAAADPFIGGDPTTLNLASLGDGNCVSTCQWTRTIRSTQSSAVEWSVSATGGDYLSLSVEPTSFVLEADGEQTLVISADVSSAELKSWNFGEIRLVAEDDAYLSEAHLPVAVRSSAGDVPDEILIETRRNAGQYVVSGLNMIDVEELHTHVYLGSSTRKELALPQDPTNDNPYDLDVGGVYWEIVDVPEGIKRFVVQTLDSQAPDLDLYVGIDADGDGLPSPDEEICFSATAAADEQCDFLPASGTVTSGSYWVLVQNWLGSGAAEDLFTLETILVGNQEDDALRVMGPPETELGSPIELIAVWDVPDLMAGDRIYAILELEEEVTEAVLDVVPITLVRLEDDVTLSTTLGSFPSPYPYPYPEPLIDPIDNVRPGDTVRFQIDVMAEPTIEGDTVHYRLEAEIPDGMSYVEDSATVPPTEADDNRLVWEIDVSSKRSYVMSTNVEDPFCAFNSYIDLESFGIFALPELSGDDFSVSFNEFTGDATPVNFWGIDYPDGLTVTDNGLAFVESDVGDNPGTNVGIPDPALPNNLLAPFWRDLAIVYDELSNRGMTFAVGGTTMVIEYDDVEPAPAGSTDERFDFEIFMDRQVLDIPGFHEIVFMYDNLNGSSSPATIGIENADGTTGLQYARDDAALFNGLAVCFDWAAFETSIQFDAMVDADLPLPAELLTQVHHSVDAPNTKTDTAELLIEIPDVLLSVFLDGPYTVPPDTPIVYTFTIYNDSTGVARDVKVETALPAATTLVGDGEVEDGIVTLSAGDIPGFGFTTVEMVVMPEGPNVVAASVSMGPVEPQIVGGGDAKPGAWPWMVAILNASIEDAFEGQFCGGTLLAPSWVLTAGHCVSDFFGGIVSPSEVEVAAGIHVLSSNEGQRVGVSQIVRHPFYNDFNLEGDVALLRLSEPVELNESVAPIRLLASEDAALAAPYVAGIVAGWGATNDPFTNPDPSNPFFDFADVLQQTTIPIVDVNECAAAYEVLGIPGLITENHLCAGFPEGGKDACFGDSGGPFMIWDGDGGWYQAGVVSGGISCGFIEDAPGYYARISSYQEWLEGEGRNTYATSGYYRVYDAAGHEAEGFIQIVTVVTDNGGEVGIPALPPMTAEQFGAVGLRILGPANVRQQSVQLHANASKIDDSSAEAVAIFNLEASDFRKNAVRVGRFDQPLTVEASLEGAVHDSSVVYNLYQYNEAAGTWHLIERLREHNGVLRGSVTRTGVFSIRAETPAGGESGNSDRFYLPFVNN